MLCMTLDQDNPCRFTEGLYNCYIKAILLRLIGVLVPSLHRESTDSLIRCIFMHLILGTHNMRPDNIIQVYMYVHAPSLHRESTDSLILPIQRRPDMVFCSITCISVVWVQNTRPDMVYTRM